MSDDRDAITTNEQCPLAEEALRALLAARPELRLDGARPTEQQLAARLASVWLPTETVLYIGLAGSSVSKRVTGYYRTLLGARSPHAGGWPIRTLSILPDLFVHYAATLAPADAEGRLVSAFVGGVDEQSAARTPDPELPLPFANLRSPRGRAKTHGITGAREPRLEGSTPTEEAPRVAVKRSVEGAGSAHPAGGSFLLNVTTKDISAGQIRVTREPKRGLDLPLERGTVDIVIRGRPLRVSWDPRLGGDQERSGILRVGRDCATRLIGQPSALTVQRRADGVVILD